MRLNLSFTFSAFFLTMTPLTAALSSLTKPSNNAKIMAKNFEVFQLKKLKDAGLLGVKRPITIVAEAVGTSPELSMRGTITNNHNNDDDDNTLLMATKLVHFQRHGQGYHNLLGEIYKDFYGKPVNLDDQNPQTNPFLKPEILDSPLTEKGRQECANRRSEACLLNPQAVIVSPLHRAIQTAMLSFADHAGDIPWIAHEGAREQMGLLLCNKRRALSQTRAEFPHIDFSQMMTDSSGDEDEGWDSKARESPQAETERIYQFLTTFLMHRPEEELALVGHSAWLFTMCNAVIDCQGDESLHSLFATSEIRSMRVSFYKTKEADSDGNAVEEAPQ
jgi:broad specificity phosphatase PhoE